MAKKKKTQLKSVARGFSTVSVPKKNVAAEPKEETEEGPTPIVISQGASKKEEDKQGLNNSVGQNTVATEEPDPEKVEEQSLQALVDRLQEKTEREIVRTIKVCFCRA